MVAAPIQHLQFKIAAIYKNKKSVSDNGGIGKGGGGRGGDRGLKKLVMSFGRNDPIETLVKQAICESSIHI